jgi:GT2 family glycosyltransferase
MSRQGTQVTATGVTPAVVSVIIVSWNAREYLTQCLDSLSARTCRYPMEVIVVDNASTDGSAEAVASRYPHVKLVQNGANLGFARANNIGIARSSGAYVCLVNSGVKVLPDCITRLVEYCEDHPEAGLVGPRIIGRDGKLQRSCRGYPSLWNMFCRTLALDTLLPTARIFSGYSLRHWRQDEPRRVDILTGCFWLAPRPAVQQVGLLDEGFFMYGEDMDWCKRFGKAGWDVAFVPAAEAIHYGGASSANAPVRFYIERYRADLRYWRKHHSRIAAGCFRGLCFIHLLLRAAGYSAVLVCRRFRNEECRLKVRRSLAGLGWLVSGRMPGVAPADNK